MPMPMLLRRLTHTVSYLSRNHEKNDVGGMMQNSVSIRYSAYSAHDNVP